MVNKKRGLFDKKKRNVLRKSALWPLVRYYAVYEAKPLLEKIRKKEVDKNTRKLFMNYLIVRTVTIFEIFLINYAYRRAKGNRNARKLFTDIKTNVSLGDQVISTFSFVKLEDLDQVFSTLLDIDFLKEIKKESVEYAPNYQFEREQIPYTKPLHKNWNFVCKIFDLRHGIVHRDKLVDLKYSEIKNLVGGLFQFMMCSHMILER